MRQTIIDAIKNRRCLTLSYNGFVRLVEPHAFGQTKEGHGILRAWQVQGGSVSHEPVGWKLLRTDEIRSVQLSPAASSAPRFGYKPGDPVMTAIYAQI